MKKVERTHAKETPVDHSVNNANARILLIAVTVRFFKDFFGALIWGFYIGFSYRDFIKNFYRVFIWFLYVFFVYLPGKVFH